MCITVLLGLLLFLVCWFLIILFTLLDLLTTKQLTKKTVVELSVTTLIQI